MSLPTLDRIAPTGLARRALRAGLSRLRHYAPRSLNVAAPIAQVFVNDDGIRTRYTFVNFPALFAPGVAAAVRYELTLYGPAGTRAARGSVQVPPFGSVDADPRTVFGLAELPAIGLITAQIRSTELVRYADRHLGRVTAHFYALYHDDRMSALSVIHPQTDLWSAPPPPPAHWESNMLIPPDSLARIEAMQVNPTREVAQTRLELRTQDGRVVASSEARMMPREVRRVVWDAAPLRGMGMLHLASDTLAAPNAKPLVFLRFPNGAFSAAHS